MMICDVRTRETQSTDSRERFEVGLRLANSFVAAQLRKRIETQKRIEMNFFRPIRARAENNGNNATPFRSIFEFGSVFEFRSDFADIKGKFSEWSLII